MESHCLRAQSQKERSTVQRPCIGPMSLVPTWGHQPTPLHQPQMLPRWRWLQCWPGSVGIRFPMRQLNLVGTEVVLGGQNWAGVGRAAQRAGLEMVWASDATKASSPGHVVSNDLNSWFHQCRSGKHIGEVLCNSELCWIQHRPAGQPASLF